MDTLLQRYRDTIAPKLQKELGIRNVRAIPRLEKIVVNMGLGEALQNKNAVEHASAQLAVITGQKPMITRAKRAIASFKLRAGDAIGLKVTLRGTRMYDFTTRLISVALPRVRDFRGVPLRGFDGRGNYTLGISELTMFPELEYRMVDKVRGMEVTFVTSSDTNEAAYKLLLNLGIPFEQGDGALKGGVSKQTVG